MLNFKKLNNKHETKTISKAVTGSNPGLIIAFHKLYAKPCELEFGIALGIEMKRETFIRPW